MSAQGYCAILVVVNRSLDSSKVKFATIINATFQPNSVADHAGKHDLVTYFLATN